MRFWRSRLFVGTLAALAVAVGGCGQSAVTISGTVTCTSHANVAGVWIAATSGDADSGFADWRVGDTNKPWVAAYQYSLPGGGAYAVHVGCGQQKNNPKKWVHEDRSDPVQPPKNSFDCADPTPSDTYGVCRRTKG